MLPKTQTHNLLSIPPQKPDPVILPTASTLDLANCLVTSGPVWSSLPHDGLRKIHGDIISNVRSSPKPRREQHLGTNLIGPGRQVAGTTSPQGSFLSFIFRVYLETRTHKLTNKHIYTLHGSLYQPSQNTSYRTESKSARGFDSSAFQVTKKRVPHLLDNVSKGDSRKAM